PCASASTPGCALSRPPRWRSTPCWSWRPATTTSRRPGAEVSATLFPYYERELVFIRQLAQEFAKQYPAAAGRLLLEPNRSIDPHVERLIESFALLAGRVHHKLDDEFPELTDALLSVLYPHYLAPVPSMAVTQFELDPARSELPQGFRIERH